MSTCCWCTPGGPATVKLLKSYASSSLSTKEVSAANDDLSYCLECVDEYHRAREEVPSLLEILWDCETTRLINHFEKSMRAEDEDDLYLVEEDKVTPLFSCYTGPDFEKRLRVPLLEVLKYPYLLLSERLSELCVEALCKMEEMNYSYQVVDKHPGIYLLMVHPNETIRRWAILTARNLGKVDRDDYYDIQEVMTSLFKVIELGLFENPDIYSSSMVERTRLKLLPSHLYDITNYKNYWLGLCMLLSVLEEQAMDSLLLGPDRQNFMQSIMNTMKKPTDGESNDPFWPMLHCFMVILDKLGSKVWGQLVDPIQAFHTIINNASYKKEIESIRQSCKRTKSEPLSDYEDVTTTCSQIVYNYNSERPHKDSRRKTTACLDYCPNLYEDMQTLTDIFQCDIGRDMRVHNSTFLWFIPFVHSLMDLKDLGVAFSIVVIHHLYSEIKEVLDEAIQPRDKVSEFFIWILLTIVELSLRKKCFNTLCVSSEKWVEVVVKCARLPSVAFKCGAERSRNGPDSVQSACMNLIRVLLKEGYQVGHRASPFLDELNLLRRSREDWKLSPQQAQELQACLIKIVRDLWSNSLKAPACGESPQSTTTPFNNRQDERSPLHSLQDHGEEQKGAVCKEQTPQRNSEFLLTDIKEEPKENSTPEGSNLHSVLADGCTAAQKNGNSCPPLLDQSSRSSLNKSSFDRKEGVSGITINEEKSSTSECHLSCRNGSRAAERSVILNRPKGKIKSSRAEFTLKLKQLVENRKRGNVLRPGSEKQQVVEEKDRGQNGVKRGITPGSSSTSNLVNCNPEGSSEGGCQTEILSVKKTSDSLAGLSRAVEVGEDSEESSTDDELNIPFTELLKRKYASPANTVTELGVDKDLKKLSLAAYTESKLSSQNPKRKVQGALRSLSDSEANKLASEANRCSNSIIIISDTSSDEEENKVNLGQKIKEDSMNKHLKKELPAQEQELLTTSSSPLPCGEYESQCFEFETNEEIYSAWEDSQLDKKSEAEVSPVRANGTSMSCDSKMARQLDDWGYDTDYLGDDIIDQAEEELEQQVKIEQKPPVQAEEDGVSKGSTTVGSKYFTAIHPGGRASSRQNGTAMSSLSSAQSLASSSSSAAKGSRLSPRKSLADSKWINTTKQSPKKRIVKVEKMSPHTTLSRSACPFIVLPQKVHRFPEPTSTVEKLGLKKRARRAAELSQRTQDSLAKLRSYGKTAGELPQKRKAKLIEPRRMVVRSKKLLASQDRQFFRQSRPDRREGAGGPPADRAKVPACKSYVQPASKMEVENQKEKVHICGSSSPVKRSPQWQCLQGEAGLHSPPPPETKAVPLVRQDSVGFEPGGRGSADLTTVNAAPLTEDNRTHSHAMGGSSPSLYGRSVALREGSPASTENIDMDNEDDLFLTQRDPVDMDLCSQVESGSSPENMDVDLPLNPLQGQHPNAENGGHSSFPATANKMAPSCQSPPAPDLPDHVFAKPFAPIKPSTKKIFSSSASSRLAHLSKELESSTNPLAVKNKSNSTRPPTSPAESIRSKLSLAHNLRSQNLNTVPWPCSLQNSHLVDDAIPCGSRQEGPPCFAPASSTYTQHRDHSIFIKYILKWSYDMFTNSRALGPPNHLLQAIVSPVPIRFQNYDDYFNILFPLMILNAFEEVAQEWLENQKIKEQKPHCLNLLNFNMDLNKADFTANISERDLDNKHHPKDDDLVFLLVSDRRSYYEREGQNRVSRHVGFVTRFSHPSIRDTKRKEQQVTCHLSIQTQGNLSRIDKEVKCIVVSSLATTHRRFRALLMLSRSPLATPILCPIASYFSPRDLNADAEKPISYMKEFNESQRRAIESAYAMITQQPSSSKICLIHGPPGTGKSKVIVGLLQRILGERSGKENAVQRPNAKIKTNRVLVCAPSNAAVDHLMKKIIAEFKNSHKKNVLGNCGNINLVRLGQQKSINIRVRKFSLNDQVDHKINKALLDKDQGLQKKKEDLDRQLDALSRLRAMDRSEKGEKKQRLEEEICRLSKERQRLASQLKEARGRSQELKASIILESHVICCTLSTSGGVLLESAFRRLGGDPVSCVIVDEAGQTCEVETLIPLIHGCKKLVLVGDPKQLPPTVKSVKAQDYRYDQSLMSRLCKHLQQQDQEGSTGKLPILQLTTQYRMHPEICLFPSKYIYKGALTTDRRVAEDRFSLAWPFQPYLLFDVMDGREERESDSYSNPQEVKLVTELIKIMKGKMKDIGYHQIGIITPYNAQKRRIQKQLVKEFGENSTGEVETVDGFQGREKDCIIVTCVRANSTQGSLGFLRSLQRLNVTITRAKYSLFILGKLKALMENKDWNELIQDAQRRGNIVQTSKNSFKSSAAKILKSRPCPPSEATVPEREAQECPGRTGGKPQVLGSSREAKYPPVATTDPMPRSSGSWPFSAPLEPAASHPPPPEQVKPVQERPQDPRLARRAELGLKAKDCKETQTSSSGPALAQGHIELLTVRSCSSSGPRPEARLETSGASAPAGPLRDMPLQGRVSRAPSYDPRASATMEPAKVWGQGDHVNVPERNREQGNRFWCRNDQDVHRRTSEAFPERQGSADPKRRRTTF